VRQCEDKHGERAYRILQYMMPCPVLFPVATGGETPFG
jgi:hypothetical protein